MKEKQVKTLADWYKSNVNHFDKFFHPGDIVGEDVINHFANTQMPITDRDNLMQMGEPQDCVNGKTTYMTFSNEAEGWVYRGNCYKGKKTSAK